MIVAKYNAVPGIIGAPTSDWYNVRCLEKQRVVHPADGTLSTVPSEDIESKTPLGRPSRYI